MFAQDQLAVTSRLFSSAVLQELARRGRSPLFAYIAKRLGFANIPSDCLRVRDVFERGFKTLQREGHRDEYVYKSALVHKILLGRHSLKTATLLSEFRVGECKADVAILNGTSTVYEVKSERDSLLRLKKQLEAYSKIFAYVNVVAAETHVKAIREMVPSHVGVIVVGRRFQLSIDREPTNQTRALSVDSIFDALRTEEARKVLLIMGIQTPVVPNTEMSRSLRSLFQNLDPGEAHSAMVKVLKVTRSQQRLGPLLEGLPASLQTAALCAPLRKADHSRLVTAVDTNLEHALAWG